LFSGQENAPNPAKTFFLENTCFRDKKTFQFQRRPLFRVPDFGALGLAPPVQKSKIVPAPLVVDAFSRPAPRTLLQLFQKLTHFKANFGLNFSLKTFFK